MSKKSGVPRQNGRGKSSIQDSNASPLHVVGCVPTCKGKSEDSRLTAFLQAQKQNFEDEDSGEMEDETRVLRAKNQKRVEEMLQKAKEKLCERKEKCNEKVTSSKREVTVPNKPHSQVNALEMLRKMEWLRNQNDHNQLTSSCTTRSTKNTVHMETVLSQPLKRQESYDYFSGTKQSKNKGKHKKKTETVISVEDLERRLLEGTIEQKPMQSQQRSASLPRQQTHATPAVTCWQQKCGSELFPDVPTRTLTVCGAPGTEDELLKLAIEESLKTHEAEKNRFIDLTEVNHVDHLHHKANNNAGIIQFPLPEPIENESWDPPEIMEQVQSPCLLEENKLIVPDQMHSNPGNITDHCLIVSRNNDEINLATNKMDESTGHYGTRENNHKKSDRLECDSSDEECKAASAYVGQPRSEHRVDTDPHNYDGDLNHRVKGACEEGVLGPLENDETWNRQQNSDRCGINKCDQNQSNPVSDPCTDWGESETHTSVPQNSAGRTQGQLHCSQKSETKNQKNDRYQIMWEQLSSSSGNRGESKAQKATDWNQEKGLYESQKFHRDHNPVPQNREMGRSQDDNWDNENTVSRNQNCPHDRPVFFNGKIQRRERNNEWGGETIQGDSKVQRDDFMYQDARICRTEEASSFEREERLRMSEMRMMRHFADKEYDDSGIGVFTDVDNRVRNDLNKCADRTELPHDKNDSCYSEVPVEQFFNFEAVSAPNSPQDVAQVFATQIIDSHLHQTQGPRVNSPTAPSQLLHAANSFLPSMNSAAEVGYNISTLPAMMGVNMQPHSINNACQVPNQAFQPSSQPLPTSNIQGLFEAFVQEQHQRMLSMHHLLQMAVMNPTGLPNIQPDLNLQAQQIHSVPTIASLLNQLGGLPTSYYDFLLQNNALLNPSIAPLLNPSLIGMNQMVAPSNAPLQSEVLSSLMGGGSTVQTPIPNTSMNMNTAFSMSPDASNFMLNHGIQTGNPLLMPSPFAVDPNSVIPAHQNYQSTQTQQPTAGNLRNMMHHVAPGPNSQPVAGGLTGVGTSNRMVIGKGRGRIIT